MPSIEYGSVGQSISVSKIVSPVKADGSCECDEIHDRADCLEDFDEFAVSWGF